MNGVPTISNLIYEIRGHKVMLDSDLAGLYEVPVKVLNQAVKRNTQRFLPDFMFQLTLDEVQNLKSQFATSSWKSNKKQSLSLEKEQNLKSQIVISSFEKPKKLPLTLEKEQNLKSQIVTSSFHHFLTPEACHKSNRRWSVGATHAEPAEGRSPRSATPAGVEQKRSRKNGVVFDALRLFNPCRGCQHEMRFSAGSASRFAGLHRRLLLFNASGVKTLKESHGHQN